MSDSLADIDGDVAALVADAADDFRARRARGETPHVQEYVDRYPAAVEEIRGALSVIGLAFGACDNPRDLVSAQTVDECETGPFGSDRKPDAEAPAKSAESLGGFEIISEIGRGGMGIVYRARDSRTGRVVALKTMKLAGGRALELFKGEFRYLQGVSHPNLVQLYALE